jgi:hypothetical protein
MAEQMSIYRLEDLSMNYWVRAVFTDFGQINIVDEYPESIATLPTVSIVEGKLSEEEFELGNREGIRIRRWYIDVFALNKSQRKDFGYTVLAEAKNGINVYDYNEGFPPDASPSIINHLSVTSRTFNPIPVIRSLNAKLYYRGQLILITKNDKV